MKPTTETKQRSVLQRGGRLYFNGRRVASWRGDKINELLEMKIDFQRSWERDQ